MPYIKWPNKKGVSSATALLSACAMAFAAAPAAAAGASPAVDTSSCTDPALTQPFASFNDPNSYTLAPGEAPNSFDGAGWTLSGGAQIVQSTLADGGTGDVLALPPGASATSPLMCVTNAYPTARAMVMGDMGVGFAVSYEGTPTWSQPKNTGQIHGNKTGWVLSGNLNLQPAPSTDWQMVRFVLTSPNKGPSTTEIYNFYVDPYVKR